MQGKLGDKCLSHLYSVTKIPESGSAARPGWDGVLGLKPCLLSVHL